MNGAQPSLTRQRILAILEEHYPCKRVPHGTWKVIATQVPVSLERVRQIATEAGWTSMPRPKRGYQCICGRLQTSANLCHECRYVELPCELCGRTVRVSAARLAWKVSHFSGDLAYSGRVFCGRECFGRWTGTSFNGRRRKERLARLYDVLLERDPENAVPPQVCADLADELGVTERWVRQHAAMLGWERSS